MKREDILKKAFQRGHLLTVKNPIYRRWIEKFIIDEVKGDIGAGDITSEAVLKDRKAKALLYSRSEGIVAGIEEVSLLLKSHGIKVKKLKDDGNQIKKGSRILILEGNEKSMLKLERSVSDMVSRMSGIATLAGKLIHLIGKGSKVGIAPTRKTQWRYLDKKAAYAGGSLTHRLALWESILIKDNHIRALKKEGIEDAIGTALERAWKRRKDSIFIEIEVPDEKSAIKAAEKFRQLHPEDQNFPCLIMLDNLNPKIIRSIIQKMKKRKLLDNVLVEASGGISPDNIRRYAKTGVDVISLGYLTTSSKALDIKLKII
ncbi:carboxylating nicotinate-nucleotide diphosphorylase [Candidatus Woesearchaeota archaeon]|nr:carboxylating nicotinate-nucleotide diphosphorylase [Candidatus Woesearchaeota archaeon]